MACERSSDHWGTGPYCTLLRSRPHATVGEEERTKQEQNLQAVTLTCSLTVHGRGRRKMSQRGNCPEFLEDEMHLRR